KLMAERSPEEIAAALIQAHRARLPQPEDLLASDAPPPSGPRPGFEGSAWFRLNVGRRQNADARWILPLLCRRGHVSRADIGAIRLAANETLFEIAGPAAAKFLAAVRRTAEQDDEVEITPVDGSPRDEARTARRQDRSGNDRSTSGKPLHRAKPAPHRGQPGLRGENAAGGKPFRKKGPWKGGKPRG
ncbi:MAG: DbpA RNA binding domain-containing protein, partial [Sphingomonadales bacterium]|nr:DbpA RNA binding domain-containing protein [Sphingomonadales bacterium]